MPQINQARPEGPRGATEDAVVLEKRNRRNLADTRDRTSRSLMTQIDQLGPEASQSVPQLFTEGDVAELLRTTVRHVRRLRYERGLPFVRLAGLVRIRPEDLASWLDQLPREERPTLYPVGRTSPTMQETGTSRMRRTRPRGKRG